MADPKSQRAGAREDVERELVRRETDESRQHRGSTPPEHVLERALEIEPGVEQHAGEDAGQVPREETDGDER